MLYTMFGGYAFIDAPSNEFVFTWDPANSDPAYLSLTAFILMIFIGHVIYASYRYD